MENSKTLYNNYITDRHCYDYHNNFLNLMHMAISEHNHNINDDSIIIDCGKYNDVVN